METIINHPELAHLKFNNAITINKEITKDMLTLQNELLISFDLSNLVNTKIVCLY